MKKYNYIYKITNTVNGKIYIGQHLTDRMDDGYMGSGTRLHQAYKKYGLECFNKEILLFYNGIDELNRGEIYWIAQFNSTDLNIGYNLTYGGEGQLGREPWNKGVPMSEEQKQKLSEAKKGREPWNKGKPMTEEQRQKISKARKGKYCGEKNSMFGKHHSEESKRKMSEAKKDFIPWIKGKHHSEESKQKLSKSRKGKYCGENNPMYGRKHSEETRRKLKLAWQKRKLAKLNQQTND